MSSDALPPKRRLVSKRNLTEGALYFFFSLMKWKLMLSKQKRFLLKITLAPALWATKGNQIKGETVAA